MWAGIFEEFRSDDDLECVEGVCDDEEREDFESLENCNDGRLKDLFKWFVKESDVVLTVDEDESCKKDSHTGGAG